MIRFFETEGIAILTMLISRYKIEVKEEPEFAGETFEQRKERIFRAKQGVTLTWVIQQTCACLNGSRLPPLSPVRMPLVFKRR